MNTGGDDQHETPSISSAMAKTTTISTIAVQSGKTRIVIALLHCGNWLQLKILEITPELTKLGATLSEALELQRAHDEVLRQLQNKKSPVEELLRQADQLIATQKPRAEVYAAMAETLGRAWRDINVNLELRRNILELNVQYHSRADEFFEKIKALEASCSDTVIPIEIKAVKEFLTNIHDLRRTLLESLMAAMQTGNSLLGKLKEMGTEGTLDSRPDHVRQPVNRALSQVQSWLDELHVRRQDVEATFNRRKLQLEQCLALAILAADLRELEETVVTSRNRLNNAVQLGDSTSSAELLQHENQKLLPEAQLLQEKALKITKATEQLLAAGCFAGEEATKQAYTVLSLTSDYLADVQNRCSLLERVLQFFKSAQLAFNKLDQLEIQITTSNLKPTSSGLIELHAQGSRMVEEITIGPISEGYNILNVAGSTGSDGVKRTIEDLENIKIRLDSLCAAHKEENMRINKALENFFEKYTLIQTWLTSIAEAFLKEHRNMGDDTPSAKDFMNLHNTLLTDLQDKGNEINALLLTIPPILDYLDDERRKDVDCKVEELHEKWMKLKGILENRLDLGRIYVKFHNEADIVNKEIDKLENELISKNLNIDDDTLKNLEIQWESLEPLYHSAKNTGLTFISDARKVFEPHLDSNRACVCVEAVLERLAGRQLQVTRSWQSFHTDILEKKELLLKIEETMVESTKTINWVTKLEAQLYPVITTESTNPREISSFIENKLKSIVPDIKRAQSEVEQKIRTAESLIAKTQTVDQKTLNVKNKLCDLNQKLIDITTGYQTLLQEVITYFISLSVVDSTVEKVNNQLQIGTFIDDTDQIKRLLTEQEALDKTITELLSLAQSDCDSVTLQIRTQEPPTAAEHDVEKLRHVLHMKKSSWDTQKQQRQEYLNQQQTFCRFDEDLKNINSQISLLENQNHELESRYGRSLEEAKASSSAYANFESTIQELDKRIRDFIVYGKNLMSERHAPSNFIEKRIVHLQERWDNFKKQIQQTRHLINLSIQYFQLVNEAEEWFKEGSRLLVSIARRSTLVKTPLEAEELLNEIATFLRPGEEKQNDRIKQITDLAEQIYGSQFTKELGQVVDESREMLKSFNIIRGELDTLGKNLLHAEQEKLRLQKEQEEAAAKAAQEAELAAEREKRAALEKARREELETIEQQRRMDEIKRQKALEEARKAELEAIEQQKRIAEIEKQKALEEARRAELEAIEQQKQKEIERQAALEASRKAELEVIECQRKIVTQREQQEAERRVFFIPEESNDHQQNLKSDLKCPVFTSPLTDAVIQEGSKFSFICEVTGTPVPVVTWFKAGVSIQNNSDYQTTFENGVCTLTIEETFSDDSARYTCKATNAGGSAETSAYLSVKEMEPEEQLVPPFFSKLLEPACIKEGISFEFNCKVEGNPLPTVQWYKNQECIDFLPGYNITYNNGNAILKFESVDLKDKGEYTCRAANQLGSAQSTASLSITPLLPTRPPSVIMPLSNIMARAGQKIKLECEVTGTPTPDIIWLQNGLQLKETHELKLHREGGKATLVIHEAFPRDAGTYKIVASSIAGEASSSCSVSVKGRLPNETSDSEVASDMEPVKPSIQLPLADLNVIEGTRVRLDCVIIGQPEPEVIWYHDERPVKESSDFQLLFQGDRCSLVIQEAFHEDEGEYKVVALNSAGEASSKCKLIIRPRMDTIESKDTDEKIIPVGYPPKFNKLLSDVLVSEGDKVVFEGNVSGQPQPEIKWLLNNIPVIMDDHTEVTHDHEGNIKLEITQVKPEDKGVYTVKACNEYGEVKCFAQLIVKSSKIPETIKYEEVKFAPVFSKMFHDTSAFEDTQTKFECIVNGKPKPKIKWLFRGQPITANNNLLVSASGDRQILSIPNVSKDSEGTITCVAENEVGSATCSGTLTVHSVSSITLPEPDHISSEYDSSFSIKREIHTESSTMMSSKVTSCGAQEPEPKTKIHSFTSHDERSFRQINQQAPEISESHNVEEYLKLGDNEPIIHEKSSSTFTNKQNSQAQITQHTLLQKPATKYRAPKFITPVIGKIVDQNTNVVLEGIVDGLPLPTISWTKNGKELSPSDKILMKHELNKASLEIKDTISSDGGRYTCTAVNEAGTALSTADLVVRKTIFPPVFGRRLQAQVIKKDERIIMEVEVTGMPEPTVTWFKDSVPIDQALTDNYKMKSFGNSHSLIIEKANLKHTGRFMVRAVNSGGEAQSMADIAVFEPTPDTMVEVVKTVVFEDIRKHETLTSATDKLSSTVAERSEPVQTIDSSKISLSSSPIPPQKQIFGSSLSNSTHSETSTFSEKTISQHMAKARLEYTPPDITYHKMPRNEDLQKQTDKTESSQIDSKIPQSEEIEEGIQTKSITKESSLQYFVKKIEESKEEQPTTTPRKVEMYKKFEFKPTKFEHEIPITIETAAAIAPQHECVIPISAEVDHVEKTSNLMQQDFDLKPEPPAQICYTEPIEKQENPYSEKVKSEKTETILPSQYSQEPSLIPVQRFSILKDQNILDEQKTFHVEKSQGIHYEKYESSCFSGQYEKQTRAVSPRPEAIQMEKLWIPKQGHEQAVIEMNSIGSHDSKNLGSSVLMETPRIHYIANVSHCIQPVERHIETSSSEVKNYEESHKYEMKSNALKEKIVKPIPEPPKWAPVKPVTQPSPRPYHTMDALSIRPASVQDITNEVFLEPGPPPILDYAQPPKVRRQSYVETVEHELESKIESIPAKVPPGGVRTIPPPPPPKVIPPPLPPKKEQPLAPPIPAKPAKAEISKKLIEIGLASVEKFSELEPFPFKPDPEKPKGMKTGPPPTPSKFLKGKFTDSDYESDFESAKIPAKWKPCASDNEEPSYRKVRAPKLQEAKRSKSTEPEPLPPSKFDYPIEFRGPTRPEIKFEQKRETTTRQTSQQFVKQYSDIQTNYSPAIKPGSPPQFLEAPIKKLDSPKTKRKNVVDGYMADTDEPFFQQKSSKQEETIEIGSNFSRSEYKSENLTESSQKFVFSNQKPIFPRKHTTPLSSIKKELTATPIITSISTENHDEIYQKQSRIEEYSSHQQTKSRVNCPPPPSPSKFVKGEFRESDYESDYDKPIHKIWKPSGPDDSATYRPIKPVLTTPRKETMPTESRPKFEPIHKPKPLTSTGETMKPETKTIVFKPKPISANHTTDVSRFVQLRPGSPPEIAYAARPKATQIYRSTTSMPYHNAIQTETSNIVHFKESTDKCHRTVSVEQSTKVIKFGDKQKTSEQTILKPKFAPPASPKKFIPCEFKESDYESDVDNVRIRPRWAPSGSETEDLHYRHVRPPSSASRASSVPPPSRERVITPMDFDKFPSYNHEDVTDSEIRRIESSSSNKFSSARSRSYEPPVKTVHITPGTPPEYGFVVDPKFKSKATKMATHHMDNMTQAFKTKTQEFVRNIMNDVDQKPVPQKSILKNGEETDPQVYREETRAAQYGTKHIDPDTGLIYFKYDFGYEFGIVLPGESKNGGIPEPQKTIFAPPKRTGDIIMPVYHENTKQNAPNFGSYPKSNGKKILKKSTKWEPTSESELSEYESGARKSNQGSDNHKTSITPPSCPATPVNAQRGPTGQIKAPLFITPLRNIAVVSGQNAKFECIVQAEPSPNILWSKNGRIIEDSRDYQIHFRNGVCRLTITKAYPEDAGTYTCTGTNQAGSASTTAILDVPGEIKSAYIK